MWRVACRDLPVGRKIPPDVLRINREGGEPQPCPRAGRNGGLNGGPALEALRGGQTQVNSEGLAKVFLDILAVTCDRKRGSEVLPGLGLSKVKLPSVGDNVPQ